MRRTKIVCTLGPETDDKESIKELMLAGMNVARINFSHGNYMEQEEKINRVKELREELGLPISLLLDTKGPEIRIATFKEAFVELKNGQMFTLLNKNIEGDENQVSITYKELYKDVKPGTTILINDGTIELNVIKIKEQDIICEVINGGRLTNRKSVNVPDLVLNLPSLTEKDIEDIKYGIDIGFEYIAASFVRKAKDVFAIKEVLKECNGEHIKIISKIENREGIQNFDEILEVSDGIMVARGDLGVEIPMEEVPIVQKKIIKKTYKQGKPVITATQMLSSMVSNPRATRAEVSDVANAIYDGSSAVMLSEETAIGKFPVECVEAMNKIAISVESAIKYGGNFRDKKFDLSKLNYKFSLNHSVCTTAISINAKAIILYTKTGDNARIISGFAPPCPIFAIVDNITIYRQLGLVSNVVPIMFENQKCINDLIKLGIEFAKEQEKIKKGDFIIVAGGPVVVQGTEEFEINKMMGGVLKI